MKVSNGEFLTLSQSSSITLVKYRGVLVADIWRVSGDAGAVWFEVDYWGSEGYVVSQIKHESIDDALAWVTPLLDPDQRAAQNF